MGRASSPGQQVACAQSSLLFSGCPQRPWQQGLVSPPLHGRRHGGPEMLGGLMGSQVLQFQAAESRRSVESQVGQKAGRPHGGFPPPALWAELSAPSTRMGNRSLHRSSALNTGGSELRWGEVSREPPGSHTQEVPHKYRGEMAAGRPGHLLFRDPSALPAALLWVTLLIYSLGVRSWKQPGRGSWGAAGERELGCPLLPVVRGALLRPMGWGWIRPRQVAAHAPWAPVLPSST